MSDRDFRLSKDVLPARYALCIEADLDAWQFRGTVDIDVSVQRPVPAVTLHALDLHIARATVAAGGAPQPATVTVNAEAETVTLNPPAPLPAGPARLALEFSGTILERLRGFYRSHKDGARYAATQFEAADARRAFPCFDEPEFKARFALRLVVPPGVTAISNGAVRERLERPDGRVEFVFAETPPISSYLVAWLIGPYEATPEARTAGGVPVRVFLPRGMADKGLYARDAHVRSLDYLEAYTGIPYPYGKVDAIGVPDFEAGAMENPGAITYRLTALAADPQQASVNTLKGIFYTAAHELTHMWWGDLVTMAWWDDLWLNESFATFVGYKTVADLVPEWGLWRDFVATLARPFALDALVSTHPISCVVRNARQATERFDVITYWKGAAVVRMLEGFLGADVFRAGVRAYLERYRERNATADDFWRELTAVSGRDVGQIADAWIRTPGHPLVHVSVEPAGGGLRLTLRQERFFADPEAAARVEPQTWPVPLRLRHGGAGGGGEERVLLDGPRAEVTLPGARWCFPNGEAAGFYRYAMDDAALDALLAVAQEALAPHERLSLVDNQWALLRAGRGSIEQFFRLLAAFRGETDRAVFAALADQLGWLGLHVVADAVRDRFAHLVAAHYEPALAALGWDPRPGESTDDRQKRATVLGALGLVARAPAVRAEARRRLERYFDDRASLDPNLVSVVAATAALDGDAELYDRYLERKRSASADPEEEHRFLLALAAFEAPALVQRTLALALTSEVRAQDRPFLLAGLLGRRAARLAAWAFVRERWADLAALMDPMLLQNLIRALGQLTPGPVASEVRAFLPPRATEETRETIAQVCEALAIDAATVRRLAPALTAWLEARQA